MDMDRDGPNLLVEKITFTFSFDHLRSCQCLTTLEEPFQHVMLLCPQVQTLGCSEGLERYVIGALHSLSTPLSNLNVFPSYCMPEYTACERRHSRTLKEYTMYNTFLSTTYNNIFVSLGTDFRELASFMRLRKLSMEEAPVYSFEHIERLLSMCPHLEDFGVELCKERTVRPDPFDELKQTIPRIQPYPKIKRFSFKTVRVRFIPGLFNEFLLKFSNLERLEPHLENISIPDGSREREGFKSLLDYIEALPSASFTIKYVDSEIDGTTALFYLKLFLQYSILWKRTSLKFKNISNHQDLLNGHPSLRYTTAKSGHRELTMNFLEFEFNYKPRMDSNFVNTFASTVNTLETDNRHTDIYYPKEHEPFVYDVLLQPAVLHSLTVAYARCLSNLPTTTSNITLHTLVLDQCWLLSVFLQSLSATCVNLRQLTLSHNKFSDMERIEMPQIELQQLNLDLKQFIVEQSSRQILIKINESEQEWYFYIDYKRNSIWYRKKR